LKLKLKDTIDNLKKEGLKTESEVFQFLRGKDIEKFSF
jgi:hypothetical protein